MINHKKILAGIAGSCIMFAALALPAFAAGSPVVGNWSVVDRGPGCWGGGNLFADGSGNGGGGCAFQTPAGEEVASLTPTSWAFTDATDTVVNLCATFVGKQGPVFPIGVPVVECVQVPVGSGAPIAIGGGTYAKVMIH